MGDFDTAIGHLLGLDDIWADQADFNELFWPVPEEPEERFRQTEKFVLYMTEELVELLRAIRYKVHRRPIGWKPSEAAVRDQLADLLKYLISLFQIWGLGPTDMIREYWRKSMVCRQRYSEEFVLNLEQPTAVVDIDNVLADYITGFAEWAMAKFPEHEAKFKLALQKRLWMSGGSLAIAEPVWQDMKLRFRLDGGKRDLPLMPGAREFLESLRSQGLNIVLLTSRPIDRYPNLYSDTLQWLKSNDLPFDFIWWATDKAEELLVRGMKPWVQFVVDDSWQFVRQCAQAGMRTYWLTNGEEDFTDRELDAQGIIRVHHLREVTRFEGKP